MRHSFACHLGLKRAGNDLVIAYYLTRLSRDQVLILPNHLDAAEQCLRFAKPGAMFRLEQPGLQPGVSNLTFLSLTAGMSGL